MRTLADQPLSNRLAYGLAIDLWTQVRESGTLGPSLRARGSAVAPGVRLQRCCAPRRLRVTRTATGLTEPAWNALLTRLGPDADSAGAEYEVLRRRLIKYFEWRGCSDGEGHADMVLTRLARKLDEGEIVLNIRSYALGVARFVLREHFAMPTAAPLDVAALATISDAHSGCEAPDDRHQCLERCLAELSAQSRALVLRYYEGDGGSKITIRHAMAREMEITERALRLRVFRARETLEECMHRCLAGWRFMSGTKQ